MFLAAGGVPPLLLVLLTMVGGCLAAASANVFNCVLDRDIDERMRRTRRRPLPRHMRRPAGGDVFGLVLGVAATLWLGFFVNWLSAALALAANAFYVFVYTMWLEAAHAAEHRLGRDRRLLPAADRLDRGHRLARAGAVRAVRDRVLLDAAAHLGAGHALPRGLRGGRRADAAGGPVAPRGRVGRSWSTRSLTVAVSLALWPVAGTGLAVSDRGRARGCGLLCGGRSSCWCAGRARADRRGAEADAAVPLVELLPGAGLRRRGGRSAAALTAPDARP